MWGSVSQWGFLWGLVPLNTHQALQWAEQGSQLHVKDVQAEVGGELQQSRMLQGCEFWGWMQSAEPGNWMLCFEFGWYIYIYFKIKQREDFDQRLSPIFLRWKTQILARHSCTELCFYLRQIIWQNAWICETSGIASYVFFARKKKRRKIMLHETSFNVGVFSWCSKLKLTLYSEYVICAA